MNVTRFSYALAIMMWFKLHLQITHSPDGLTAAAVRPLGLMREVQGRVLLASSLAQALTKRAWDGSRAKVDFVVGEQVLIHRTAPNRLLPHFIGPYTVTAVTADGNFVTAVHFVDKASVMGPVHVSRLLHFDGSRATPTEIISYQLEPGSFVVDSVIEHRVLGDGSYEFHLRWVGTPVTSWQTARDVKRVDKVVEYCASMGLPPPGTALAVPHAVTSVSAGAAGSSVRGARGGRVARGRGGRGGAR